MVKNVSTKLSEVDADCKRSKEDYLRRKKRIEKESQSKLIIEVNSSEASCEDFCKDKCIAAMHRAIQLRKAMPPKPSRECSATAVQKFRNIFLNSGTYAYQHSELPAPISL